ncbi:tuberous sclerosis 1 protein hamartin isoform X3 [Oratosquilla oratoria]|uniref:tuberous sclerosis 1 protein hamartin isoform X3 n=1 Tax=Oratosquilla oratoria TaxID=337810 RepID=UPI003F76BD5F
MCPSGRQTADRSEPWFYGVNDGSYTPKIQVVMCDLHELDAGDLLGLLECPQQEVVEELRSLLKDALASVRESWLVAGLLDYFFQTNSARILDLLLTLQEPHDRHLLEKLQEGMKGQSRFRYTSLLLYAVRRQPPPLWLRKFVNHGAMRELLHLLQAERELSILVNGLLVLVILMPILPFEIGQMYLMSILEIFRRLVLWSPKKDDNNLELYLQVAVYSFFHRLYALYPCNLVTYLRANFSGSNNLACFFSTIKPMMERVKLHPLLVSGSKEMEVSKSRWLGMETHELVLECAKLCLDSMEATGGDNGRPWFLPSSSSMLDADFECVQEPCLWIQTQETGFWSPSMNQSPAPLPNRGFSSQPQTPVYPVLASTQRATRMIAESPPEAAIEATPETTPFTSPIKADSAALACRHPLKAATSLNLNTSKAVASPNASEGINAPGSPLKKDKDSIPFRFPENQGQDLFSLAGKSVILQSKLQQIQKERQQCQKENMFDLPLDNDGKDGKVVSKGSIFNGKESNDTNQQRKVIERQVSLDDSLLQTKETSFSEVRISESSAVMEGRRRRKVSVYDRGHVDTTLLVCPAANETSRDKDLDFLASSQSKETKEKIVEFSSIIERRLSEEREDGSAESRKSSDSNEAKSRRESENDTENQGLGVPNHKSMTELVRNMRTMRLRFLSQCGPPPDCNLLGLGGQQRIATSPPKGTIILPSKPLERSFSCPSLNVVIACPGLNHRQRKESQLSSMTLSPTRHLVLTSEVATQTDETDVVNPYEQLLDILLIPAPDKTKQSPEVNKNTTDDTSTLSPHQMLDNYVQAHVQVSSDEDKPFKSTKGPDPEVKMIHSLLMFERHKREVHAERNRRLSGKVKRAYALEEQQSFMKEEYSRMEKKICDLKDELQDMHNAKMKKEQLLQGVLAEKQEVLNRLSYEKGEAKQERDNLDVQCRILTKDNESITSELHRAQSLLIEKERQLTHYSKLSSENAQMRKQIEALQTQILLMGELQMQYQLQLSKVSQNNKNRLAWHMEQTAMTEQVRGLQEAGNEHKASLEAFLDREATLEQQLSEKDKLIEDLKKLLKIQKEEATEQCRAVERRCQALKATNQSLHSHLLELQHRNDTLSRQVRRSLRGKSVCSDGLDIEIDLSSSVSSSSPSSGGAVSLPGDAAEGTLAQMNLLGEQPLKPSDLDAVVEQSLESETLPSKRKV